MQLLHSECEENLVLFFISVGCARSQKKVSLISEKKRNWNRFVCVSLVQLKNLGPFFRFFSHLFSLPQGGGSYGTFGGYDITLIELTAAVPPTFGKPACLPTVSFKDTLIKANLAGYGQFYRRDMSGEDVQKCLTDQYGRNKYHPCAESGTGETVCHTKTPPPQAPACQAFFNQTALAYPEEYEEIQLVDKKGATVAFCFDKASPVPKSRGWCKTDANYYNFKEVQEEGWGFCSGDCYLGDIKARVENTVKSTFSNKNRRK